MKYGKNGVKRVNATLTFGIQKDKLDELDELNLYHFQRGNAVLTRASGSFKNYRDPLYRTLIYFTNLKCHISNN